LNREGGNALQGCQENIRHLPEQGEPPHGKEEFESGKANGGGGQPEIDG